MPLAADGAADPAPTVLDVDHFVPFFIGVIANKVVNSGSLLLRRRFGVGFAEWRILAMLALEPGIAAKRICQIVGMDKGDVSRGLRVLETGALIEATPDSVGRRSRGYVLTEAGKGLQARILAIELEREARLLARLRPAEVPVLLDMLRRMLTQLPEVEDYDPPDE